MSNVLSVILGGGPGAGLYPLTRERAEPAMPLAGKYRLIDIPLSNCFHAGIDKMAILTQFNSVSLHRHIYSTYVRDVFSKGWIQILAAEQTRESQDWYHGTADAVRKQMAEISDSGAEYVLILAGDHIYRMDYRRFVNYHIETKADVTIAIHPVDLGLTSSLGILKLDEDFLVEEFIEKPQNSSELIGFESEINQEKPYLASMGIYIFNIRTLNELLQKDNGHDFGRDVIPVAIRDYRVAGYIFEGFWEDIGSIKRFYDVHLSLALDDPPFDFFSPERPIYTRPRFLPGSEIHESQLDGVLLGDGCRITNSIVSDSVIGLRSIIASRCNIQRSIIMGADYYESQVELVEDEIHGRPPIGIGANSQIEGAIIDKNARIGQNVRIRYQEQRPDCETDDWVARAGLIIVPKNGIIPDGTVI